MSMPPVKKIIMWLVVLFAIYAIVTSPDQAANIVKTAWDIVWTGVTNIATFFNRLIGN
ncbi:hypothetical protein [Kribbia dieselivorans]|uniref:hypothetical protein n=1 Tax=Kribbia dieselivorans TaxID=331526 RepID=UPI0012EE297B|nr:hypothetical protein [Kribbia dieselivorans]